VLALALAGCTNVFSLPFGATDLSAPDLPGLPPGDGFFVIPNPGDGGTVFVGEGGVLLPSACALLPCTPPGDEGDAEIASGSVSGCHAYDKLTINNTVKTTGFSACANVITIGGALDGNDGGYNPTEGPGAGSFCGSGGSHGGAGADPAGCGAGKVYDDAVHPRQAGSGGGGLGAGRGGGQIELAAGTVNLIGLIRADGEDGFGASAGGGAGGSILIETDLLLGAGRIEALGGAGVGLRGGGGGGGRVSIVSTTATPVLDITVHGGVSSNGALPGASGTINK
jgi:hypothetical protein